MKVLMIIIVVALTQVDIKPANGQFSFFRLRRPTFNLPSISNPIPNPISGPVSGYVLPVQQPQPQPQPQPQIDTSRLVSQMVSFGKLLATAAEASKNNGTSASADETDEKAKLMAKMAEVYKPVIDKGLHKAADFDKGLMELLKHYLGDIFDDAAEGAYKTVDKLTGTNQSSTT